MKFLRSRFRLLVFGIIVLNGLALSPSVMAQDSSWKKRTKVEVIQLSPQVLKSYSTYIGHLKPKSRVKISSEIAGVIENLDLDVGAEVKAGQVVARIDTRKQRLNRKLNQSNYELALEDYKREKKLAEKKLSTAANLSELKNKVEVNKLKLELSTLDLNRSEIKSPINGVVKAKYVEAGEYIGVGKKVIEIIDLSEVLAVVHVPEREIRFTSIGKKVQVLADAQPNRTFIGAVKTIGLEADTKSRSFEIEIAVSNPGRILLPGMLSRVKMLKHSLNNQLVIPRHTIQEESTGSFVYIVKNGRTIKRAVKLGISTSEEVQVISGLTFGDYLVESGHQLITPRELVSVIKLRKQS